MKAKFHVVTLTLDVGARGRFIQKEKATGTHWMLSSLAAEPLCLWR
jgi:hypothetical protein